jgi:hypothetical protein
MTLEKNGDRTRVRRSKTILIARLIASAELIVDVHVDRLFLLKFFHAGT